MQCNNPALGNDASSGGTILLISDRPEQRGDLTKRLCEKFPCEILALYGEDTASGQIAAVITDVSFRRPADIDRLRHLLTQPRALAAPILALLRNDGHLERIQASAVGATVVLPAHASAADIFATLAPKLRSRPPKPSSVAKLAMKQSVELAQLQFTSIFGAVARKEIVDKIEVDNTAKSVMSAVIENGIRPWLEVVWTYDDATYQHCLMVTGLAAAFAADLGFGDNDQRHVIRAALLHDIGKAKIPIAILNKPAALTHDEMAIMRTHAELGHRILSEQGGYEPDVLAVVRSHHEMLDGSGYPDGLVGAQISDLVRIVTICDIYTALIERRPYREPMVPAKAFSILEAMDGKIERALVQAFARVAQASSVSSLAA